MQIVKNTTLLSEPLFDPYLIRCTLLRRVCNIQKKGC